MAVSFGRAVTRIASTVLTAIGPRRVDALSSAIVVALARPRARMPSFRFASELAAVGIGPTKLARVLGRIPAKRKITMLATLAGIAASSYARTVLARRRHEAQPVGSPPPLRELILATTVRCNLRCVGCYTESERVGIEPSAATVDAVLVQAKRLGLSRVHLVGKGEPFLSARSAMRTLDVVRRHPDVMFDVFTNGVAIDERTWADIAALPNLIVIFSLAGLRATNDAIRGAGVHDAVMRACARAQSEGIAHGFGVTVTATNYEEVTSSAFIASMAAVGSLFGVYFKYSVLDPQAPEGLALTPSQAFAYEARLREANECSPLLLGDPDVLERGLGCRSRAGALLYADLVTGAISPCVKTPFAPPDCNVLAPLHDGRLAEILCGTYFRSYRKGAGRGITCSSHGAREQAWFAGNPALDPSTRARARRDAEARGHRISLPVLG